MSLQKEIQAKIKEALLERDTMRLTVLRGLLSAFTMELLNKKSTAPELTDDEALAVIKRAVKQRKDSIEQFTKGNRQDLVVNEQTELKILETYLPAMMSREDIKKFALAKKTELGITDKAGLGKFVGILMKELKNQADGSEVKAVAEEIFS